MTKSVRITQIDGKLPNIALMRLAQWHKKRGDEVYFTSDIHKSMFEPNYDYVYGSAIFKFSQDKVAELKKQFPDAVIGGTGTASNQTIESITGDDMAPHDLDYSIYPDYKHSIGFTQRGCRLKCAFCVVPKKEGAVNEVSTIKKIWRGNEHPKNIMLLDNDFFGNPKWLDLINEIREGDFKVCFSQGINIRLVSDKIAANVASVKYYDNKFKTRRIYTAWDSLGDEGKFFRGVEKLIKAGIRPNHIMAYMLIGYAKNETIKDIFYRFNKMVGMGILPYPMVYNQDRKDLKHFQRWVITGIYRHTPWNNYWYNKHDDPHPHL